MAMVASVWRQHFGISKTRYESWLLTLVAMLLNNASILLSTLFTNRDVRHRDSEGDISHKEGEGWVRGTAYVFLFVLVNVWFSNINNFLDGDDLTLAKYDDAICYIGEDWGWVEYYIRACVLLEGFKVGIVVITAGLVACLRLRHHFKQKELLRKQGENRAGEPSNGPRDLSQLLPRPISALARQVETGPRRFIYPDWALWLQGGVAVIAMWANFILIALIRAEARDFFGPTYSDDTISYGQIITSGLAAQALVTFFLGCFGELANVQAVLMTCQN